MNRNLFRSIKKKINHFYLGTGVFLVGLISFLGVLFDLPASIALRNLANVTGISVSIAPNEYNVLAQELQRKENELSAREQELENQFQNSDVIVFRKTPALFAIGGITIVLLMLIVLNFYLDVIREKRREGGVHEKHGGEFRTKIPDR